MTERIRKPKEYQDSLFMQDDLQEAFAQIANGKILAPAAQTILSPINNYQAKSIIKAAHTAGLENFALFNILSKQAPDSPQTMVSRLPLKAFKMRSERESFILKYGQDWERIASLSELRLHRILFFEDKLIYDLEKQEREFHVNNRIFVFPRLAFQEILRGAPKTLFANFIKDVYMAVLNSKAKKTVRVLFKDGLCYFTFTSDIFYDPQDYTYAKRKQMEVSNMDTKSMLQYFLDDLKYRYVELNKPSWEIKDSQ